jgi:hypothetical protein
MRKSFRLYLLVLINGLSTIIAALNLSANVFVLKATRWTDAQVWSLDLPQTWLYYSPLLFPLWYWILLRDGFQNSLADRTAGGNIFGALLRTIPPGARPWLIAGTILSVLWGFPFAHVDLSGGPAPDSGVLLRHYWQSMVIAGLARPGAILFCAAGLWVLLRPRKGSVTKWLFAALLGAILLRIVLAGPAIPRLEDEVAYHLQALIFEAGQTRGRLSAELAATGISTARLGEILQLPYVFFDPVANAGTTGATSGALAYFSSAHFHGWSAILAALSWLALKPYANALLVLLNFGLFAWLLRRVAADEFTSGDRITAAGALFLFACAPATVILTGTYMSHVAAQTLLLFLFLAHCHIRSGTPLALPWSLAILAALIGMAFVRLQAAAPALLALTLADLMLIGTNGLSGRKRHEADSYFSTRSAVLRLGVIATATLAALWIYDLYSRAQGAGDWFFTRAYLHRYFEAGCQAIGWGPGHGCFPTYGSLGHSFRKFLLNGFDRVSELNHELSPAGLPLLPLALLLAARHWRSLLDPRRVWLKFTLAFLGATGVYSLYFHNGGESYRGRYVFEAVFAFYLIFAKLAVLELEACFEKAGHAWRDRMGAVVFVLAPAILFTNVAFTIRGDYFSRFIQPYANINAVPEFGTGGSASSARVPEADPPEARTTDAPLLTNALISSRDLVEQLGEREARTGAFYYPLEFEPGARATIPIRGMKAFLNLGYATLAATATRLDSKGLPRDAHGNVLVGEATPAEIRSLANFLRIAETRRLVYRLPETERIRRGLVRWILHPPELRRIDATP